METYGYQSPNPAPQPNRPYRSEKKIAAALLGLFLGTFAGNKWVLGYQKEALLQIAFNVLTCGLATVIPFIEGIIYLTMDDETFDRTYVKNKKSWF